MTKILKRIFKLYIFALSCLCLPTACQKENRAASSIMFGEAQQQAQTAYDLADVQSSGELIAVTLSGPDTYYEYRGQGFGLQFKMTEAYANSIGTRLRMEMVSDTAELVRRLISGEADMIALEVDSSTLTSADIKAITILPNHWAVRTESDALAESIKQWWNPQLKTLYLAAEQARQNPTNRIRRHTHPEMLSRSKGTISAYDALFIRHAQVIGWDWRLLAAQCYQESAFDSNAVSWAGAQGLMQLMPSTAEQVGISQMELLTPNKNIEAAVKYLARLQTTFSDISHRSERIRFMLAAYNGGVGHIRDAMMLAVEDGLSAQSWNNVSPYILRLEQPRYYRHPKVKFGYLRGNETVDYVNQIMQRWADYRRMALPHSNVYPHDSSRQKPSRVRPRSEFLNDSIP